MKLVKATLKISVSEVELENKGRGVVRVWINGHFIVDAAAGDDDQAWVVANAILVKVVGERKGRGGKGVANVTNSEICDLGRVIEQIADNS